MIDTLSLTPNYRLTIATLSLTPNYRLTIADETTVAKIYLTEKKKKVSKTNIKTVIRILRDKS